MAEELGAGICGETWWNSSKTMFTGYSWPCSTGIAADMGWSTADMVDIKARSSYDDSLASQLGAQQADSDSILIDSTIKMMGFDLPSSTTSDWNQSLIRQETGMDSSQIQKVWSPGKDSCITTLKLKPINQYFSSEDQRLNSVTSSGNGPMSSYGYPSPLSQTLLEQQSVFDNKYMPTATTTYGANNDWQKLDPFVRPSWIKQQPSSLHFTDNVPFWNASAKSVNDVKTGFLPSHLLQTFEEKPNCPSLTKKTNPEEFRNLGSAMKKGLSNEPPLLKRTRIETPSSLPTFKVRKEKLGYRITALQQLVSPFGKTDTASVLHEAIEYIKFLHDQVNVLSSPYMKQAAASTQQQQSTQNLKDPEGTKQDLRSLGLCLVPISSTFPVANETTVDFWTPTFGGTFR